MYCRLFTAVGLIPVAVFAQQPVSTDIFDKIVRYTAFSAAAYQDNCTTPPFGSTIVQNFDIANTDTQASMFRDDKAKEIIVAFRGTSSPKDLDSDLAFTLVPLSASGTNCSDCKVHNGFQRSYVSIMKPIAEALQGLLCGGDWRFVVTGHSLGGGIAAIAATSFAGLGFQPSEVFTFGEPRNGDAAWAKYASKTLSDDKYYRVTHFTDGVPQIPPVVLGYVHHSPEYYQSQDTNNTAESTWKCEIDSPKCNAGQSFGSTPVNNAHVTYSNTVVGSSLTMRLNTLVSLYIAPAAIASILQRDGNSVVSSLSIISDQLKTMNMTLDKIQGPDDAQAAVDFQNEATQLQTDLQTATDAAKNSTPFSDSDSSNVAYAVVGVTDLTFTVLDKLAVKRDVFDKLGGSAITDLVRDELQGLQNTTDTFSTVLSEKFVKTVRDVAPLLVSSLDFHFYETLQVYDK
ncbi:hypothetical protein PWT90_00455 [Aphanocladium album]|nr:hypothetical protein PWT90_00455 [Aphanocladium album]